MKIKNYIVMIIMLLVIKLLSIVVPLAEYGNLENVLFKVSVNIICIILYFVFCKKTIKDNKGNTLLDKVIVIIAVLVLSIKIITFFPIFNLKNDLVKSYNDFWSNPQKYNNYEQAIEATKKYESKGNYNIILYYCKYVDDTKDYFSINSNLKMAKNNGDVTYKQYIKSDKKEINEWKENMEKLLERDNQILLYEFIRINFSQLLIIVIPFVLRYYNI